MKQRINMYILKQADETTQQRIAEEFTINWEKEEVFEKAFQTYLEQSKTVTPPAAPIRRYVMHIISAAACCILVLGAAYAIGFSPRQIPSIQEESTTASLSAVIPTEVTEHTENTEHTEKNEHTVPETECASETSGLVPEISRPISTLPETTAPPAITETVTMPSVPETHVSEITQPISTESQQEATDTSPETTVPEEPEYTTFPEVDAPEQSEDPDFPVTELLPGFDVSEQDGHLEIAYRGQVTPSPTEILYYEIESDVFELEFIGSPESGEPITYYRLLHKETGEYFSVSQKNREQFLCFCESNAELIPIDVNGNPAFMAQYTEPYGREYCVLYWDDGYYTFRIISTPEHREVLPKIAETFRIPDQSDNIF